MRIKINKIADAGVLNNERIVMKALSDADVGKYAVFESRYRDDSITTGVEDVFWFPDKEVSKGDYVVLYTKRGNQSEKTLRSGNKSHFFYWGSTSAKWGNTQTVPALLEIADWETHVP